MRALCSFYFNYISKPAKKALQGLAYKRYRRVPIYLEWAPDGLFKSEAALAAADASASNDAALAGETNVVVDSEMGISAPVTSESVNNQNGDVEDADKVTSEETNNKTESSAVVQSQHVVFIKNLNWETVADDVKEFIGELDCWGCRIGCIFRRCIYSSR
jgi:multiple RNA-binding domain-containing protein 1